MTKKKPAEEEGMSLDDAFADDEDVEYAQTKPKKKPEPKTEKPTISNDTENIQIKASKPIEKIKKGDKIKIDSLNLEVDAHIVLMDHGSTKEMAIECFDPKTDKDYQVRYFSDQVETSLEAYSLEEIVYSRMNAKKIEW
jgi:hypothetical protein